MSHSKQDCDADHRDEPWLWMAQLQNVQSALCLELVPGDDICFAGREVDRCTSS
jgi:hypothetical protein